MAGDRPISAFTYRLTAQCPNGYFCNDCGITGVKLWRHFATTKVRPRNLFCAKCACKLAAMDDDVDDQGQHRGARSERLGGFVPAIPSDDGRGFWAEGGDTPDVAWTWWVTLPTRLPF